MMCCEVVWCDGVWYGVIWLWCRGVVWRGASRSLVCIMFFAVLFRVVGDVLKVSIAGEIDPDISNFL